MAKQIVLNPDWVEAPYEMVLFDSNGARVVAFDRIEDGPTRFIKDAEGNFVHIPKYIEKEIDHGTT